VHRLLAWDQTHLRELAEAARNGIHIKQETARAFENALVAATTQSRRARRRAQPAALPAAADQI
jgi:hypothetical protein